MVVDSYDPHEPWDPPQRFVDLYDSDHHGGEPYTPREGSSDYLTERQLKRMRALYAAEVTMADRWLGRFLEKIDELSLFENTLLLLLSDHGHALGEDEIVGKPVQALWPELTDIVFLIRHPEGKRAGQRSDFYASTHDLAPTILYFSRNDGAKAKPYDVRADPKMRNDLAKDRPEVAKRMFEDYVLRDAGGSLPRYRTPAAFR
jgi:arylsulfatase A-like enzyme